MDFYQVATELGENDKSVSKYSKVLRQLLHNRGIIKESDIDNFLNPRYEEELHDPFLLNEMTEATDRILRAIKQGEKICIYSDYDCDGIPGAVVWHDFFRAISYTNFFSYIPHRHLEGFGFNVDAVDKIQDKDADLIITVDCGTSDVEAVQKANQLNIDVVITDHHEAGEVLPEALAIVNPKVGDNYPFKHLCGAGVVFKVVTALLAKGNFGLKPGQEKWWLDMVGLATLADMVELRGENRTLAYYGLKVLRKSRRPGLQQLLRKQRCNQAYLTEDDVGFTIGPRINAASRMDSPEIALELLIENDEKSVGNRVENLEKLNNERKGIVASMVREAHGKVAQMESMPEVLVVGNPLWRPSLVGLVAGKLADEHNKPCFAWGRDGKGVIKGSCRSDGDTNVVDLMSECSEFFLEYGGHHMSGGFSVHESKIHDLPQALLSVHGSKLTSKSSMKYEVDMELSINDVNSSLIKDLERLAPFGVGNEKPIFLFKNVAPRISGTFGKSAEHTKLVFDTVTGPLDAIAFFKLPRDFKKEPTQGEPCNLIANVERSFFMGRSQIRLRLIEIF
tara:strand:+ start:4887 stop:6578 length:1692 start_codon:yes stop_codon:yes gene_type:complete